MAQPETPDSIDEAALMLGLKVPEACRDGVAANLALLRTHAAVLFAVPPEGEPAS